MFPTIFLPCEVLACYDLGADEKNYAADLEMNDKYSVDELAHKLLHDFRMQVVGEVVHTCINILEKGTIKV